MFLLRLELSAIIGFWPAKHSNTAMAKERTGKSRARDLHQLSPGRLGGRSGTPVRRSGQSVRPGLGVHGCSSIPVGYDFRKAIDDSVATCGVLLAVIGKNWVDAKNEAGESRLNDPSDFVRLETAAALKRDIPVIPVLVRGAKMPRANELPADLKDLAFRNGCELTHARWGSDLQLLITALRPHLESAKPAGPVGQGVGGGAAVAPAPSPLAQERETHRAAEGVITQRRSHGVAFAIALGAVIAVALAAYLLFFPRPLIVPDLTGDSLSNAISKLNSANLRVGRTTAQEQPDSVLPDTVISQSPAANSHASRETAVDLVYAAPFYMLRSVTDGDLQGKTKTDLERMRNEIYALHGGTFVRKDLQDYFASQSW